jgi:hypothetical protein
LLALVPLAVLGASAAVEREALPDPLSPNASRDALASDAASMPPTRVDLDVAPPTPVLAESVVDVAVCAPAAHGWVASFVARPIVSTSGLFLLAGGDAPEFERWFAGANDEHLVRCRHRAQRLVALGVDSELTVDEIATVQREEAWLAAKIAAFAAPAFPLEGLALRLGASESEIDALYAPLSDEDVAFELWRVERAEQIEKQRRSETMLALGFYEIGSSMAVG